MSIISSKSNKERQGFTPYQSDQELNDKQLSLLQKLNLNDQIPSEQSPHFSMISFDKYSCDLKSINSKKRKLSEQCINVNASKLGRNTFLNRSIIGRSSLDNSFMHQLQFIESHEHAVKKELSENSCPILVNNEEKNQFYFADNQAEIEKPRFTKTKNLLRNLSNYMHKFLLYNKRGQDWIRDHYMRQEKKKKKKERRGSESVSLSNRSSELSCFQDMCRLDDTIKIEDTPKIQPKMMNYVSPIRYDSDILLNSGKESQSFDDKSSPMKQEKLEQFNEDQALQVKIRSQIKQYQVWVSDLSIVSFSDYESIWTTPHRYRGLYRICCYKYYRSQAFCDIYRSRLTTKQISASYLHQFIQGMLQPRQFYRFK